MEKTTLQELSLLAKGCKQPMVTQESAGEINALTSLFLSSPSNLLMTTWATEHENRFICAFGASLVAQSVKILPAVQETQVQFLGQEDPLEKEMAAHSSILAWTIPWIEEPGGPQSMGLQELDPAQ